MFKSVSSVKSSYHNLNPFIKIVSFLLFCLAVILKNDIKFIGILGIVLLIIILISNIDLRFFSKFLGKIKYVLLIIFLINALVNIPFLRNIVIIFKITYIYLYFILLLASISDYSWYRFFYCLFLPLKIFNINISKLSFKVFSFFKNIPLFFKEYNRIMNALSLKGLDYLTSNIFGKIKAIKISISYSLKNMLKLSNNYNFDNTRTFYRRLSFGLNDCFIIVGHVLLILAIILKDVVL